MGLFDFLKGEKPNNDEEYRKVIRQLKDIRLAIGQNAKTNAEIQQAIKTKRRTLPKPLQYGNPVSASPFDRNSNKAYHGPVHDLSEIARAMDVEPYISASIRKHREQILKEGYRIVGEDEEMVDYIHKRIFEMEMASGQIFEEVVREYATSLVTYGTGLLLKRRDPERSSGLPIRLHGKRLEPIAAVYPVDPTSMSVKINDFGHPVRWQQRIDESTSATESKERFYSDHDIIMAVIDKKPGFVFGTPYVLPVLDDVRALRILEELAEVAARKYAFPSIHWKVGTDEFPVEADEDGITEVDIVRQEIENMTPEGGMVTSHVVDHQVVGVDSGMMDLAPLIEYFELRVLGGLRLSPVDLGRGDVSKASAGAVSNSLKESSKDFQTVLANKLTYELIVPLLFEGGFKVTHENMVKFSFPSIDKEEERANQQHGMDMCNNSVITCTEFRRDYLGKKSFEEGEMKDTKDDMKHERDLDLAKQAAAAKAANQSSSSSGSSSSKNSAAAKTVANKVRPANQSGKKAIRTSITANNNFEDQKALHRLDIQSLNLIALEGLREGAVDASSLKATMEDYVEGVMEKIRPGLESSMGKGIEDALEQMGIEESYTIPPRSVDRFLKNYVTKTLDNTTHSVVKHLENSTAADSVGAIFAQLDDDTSYLSDRYVDMSYRFGFAKAAKKHGAKSFSFEPVDGEVCEDCEDKGAFEVSLENKDMPYNLLLRTHNSCTFNMVVSLEEKSGKN